MHTNSQKSHKRYSEAKKAEAQALYEDGVSLARISRKAGFPNDPKIIRGWLLKRGVKLRANPQIYPRKKILKELQEGKKDRKAIQEKYGCSAKYLSNLFVGKLPP